VNFNLYLDRLAAERLARLAKSKKQPRNALIRQAVQDWLTRQAQQWPTVLLEYSGDGRVAPFESHRAELASLIQDPFAPEAPSNGRSPKNGAARKRRAR
jgi:predicted transcriptional regulator